MNYSTCSRAPSDKCHHPCWTVQSWPQALYQRCIRDTLLHQGSVRVYTRNSSTRNSSSQVHTDQPCCCCRWPAARSTAALLLLSCHFLMLPLFVQHHGHSPPRRYFVLLPCRCFATPPPAAAAAARPLPPFAAAPPCVGPRCPCCCCPCCCCLLLVCQDLSSRWLYVWSRGGGALSLMISRLVSSSKPDMRPKHPHNAAWGSGGGGGCVQCTRRNTRGQYLSTEVKHGGECVNVLPAALHDPAAILIQGLGTHTAQPGCMGGWAGVGPGGGAGSKRQ